MLTPSTAPEIRGLKLGMKFEEVGAIIPDSIGLKLAPKADETGLIDSISLSLIDWYQRADQFTGVKMIFVSFLDGRVSKLGIAYDESTQWPSVEDFIGQISKTLNLPSAWRNPTNADAKQARVMDCDGFRIIARISIGQPSIIGFVDTGAERTVNERRAAIEEKKRQTFKP